MKTKIRAWFRSVKNHIIAYWASFQDWVAIMFRFAHTKLRALIIQLQRIFGFDVINTKRKTLSVDISTILKSTDQILSELPKDYRKHFLIEKDITEELYIRPENASMLEMRKVLEAWTEGIPASAAIIGEKGSGKSAYINLLMSDTFSGYDCKCININQSTWKMEQFLTSFAKEFGIEHVKRGEAFIHELKQQGNKQIVILEGMQNLFLRNINGYDVLEALWLIISETKDQIFWVFSCSRYAWNFLNSSFGVETHFNLIQHTDSLKREQIEALIMRRHELSGYKIEFLPNEDVKKNRSYRKRLHKPDQLQIYLRHRFFDHLSEDAKGNASVAIILWQRSIYKVEDETVYIRSYESFSLNSLEALTSEILFVAAAFVLHGSLKVAELARVLNIELSASRVLLTRLKSKGILLEQDGLFQLNQLVYRQILTYLQRRNVIH